MRVRSASLYTSSTLSCGGCWLARLVRADATRMLLLEVALEGVKVGRRRDNCSTRGIYYALHNNATVRSVPSHRLQSNKAACSIVNHTRFTDYKLSNKAARSIASYIRNVRQCSTDYKVTQ